MTAPMAGTGRPLDSSNIDAADRASQVNGSQQTNGQEQTPRQRDTRTTSGQEGGEERPEIDDFVKGFYDGDRFTDVDSRVWV